MRFPAGSHFGDCFQTLSAAEIERFQRRFAGLFRWEKEAADRSCPLPIKDGCQLIKPRPVLHQYDFVAQQLRDTLPGFLPHAENLVSEGNLRSRIGDGALQTAAVVLVLQFGLCGV